MTQTIRLFLFVEAASFIVAALIHMGFFISGYEHRQARMAESVIGGMLFGGFLLSLFMPDWTRNIGVVVQLVALLGTVIGVATIIIGIGPRTVPDVIYHIVITLVLAVGIAVARSVRADSVGDEVGT
jgi:prepilin signal peptidase PulO-like enzyme (type II secretory pathway)